MTPLESWLVILGIGVCALAIAWLSTIDRKTKHHDIQNEDLIRALAMQAEFEARDQQAEFEAIRNKKRWSE